MADGLPDPGEPVELPGPWQHRHVAANGARFHVAEAGAHDAPLVLLVHGFPELWWSWRHQLPVLADAGYRAVAMDLRGYGGSDMTPRGYDPVTLAQDVAGVVKALGARRATVVGHGWGGYVGWATAVLHAREVSALCAVSSPHPLTMLDALRRHPRRVAALRHVLAMQVPMLPERRLADPESGYLRDHLAAWSAPGSAFPSDAEVTTYQRAIGRWPSSHCALEYHRWLFRSRLRADGRRFSRAMGQAVAQPVLCVVGDDDPALPPDGVASSRRHVAGPLTEVRVPGVGHFPHEEEPDAVTRALLDWLPTTR
ncbi:MAG: alpha/beta hydrolase [Nocardioidaceae bacterium]|nr:alpha/beta hydrolase [Nocardioidaceae bacterium]NUS51842.1 alpha/beta hydrolase [Nocardioidaceae bacterium]